MLRHITSAAAAVFRRPGAAPRHGSCFLNQGGGGVGFPHVKCRFADQYGMEGAGSGSVFTDSLLVLCCRPGWGILRPGRLRDCEEGFEREVDR
jgi:hypothetical protein